MQQLSLPGMVERRGGKRKGAGRKRQADREMVSHRKRKKVTRHKPLLVTFRVKEDLPNLRTRRVLQLLEDALRAVKGCEGFRVVHYALLSNHVHLLVEGDNNVAVSKGMHSLGIRFARALNRMLGRKGAVLADRYHARELSVQGRVLLRT